MNTDYCPRCGGHTRYDATNRNEWSPAGCGAVVYCNDCGIWDAGDGWTDGMRYGVD